MPILHYLLVWPDREVAHGSLGQSYGKVLEKVLCIFLEL